MEDFLICIRKLGQNANTPYNVRRQEDIMLDDLDCDILAELQTNARIPFAELGRRVGLSTPAVIERVRRLEDNQVILGYRTAVDPSKVGLPVRAFVHVTVAGDKLAKFASVVRGLPEVLECHRVTGAQSFIVQVAVRDVGHMEEVIDSMMPYVSTNTSMVLASPVPWNSVLPAQRYAKKGKPRKPVSGN
jgi:Lrp/AsnC family transcriptional regulator, leucine-responsive regulatory protein